jgi:hypothetical protein
MIDNEKIIEKSKQSMSFIEQLQNQIQLCREAMSNSQIPLTPRVETLEALLWAKLKDDEEYLNAKKIVFDDSRKEISEMKVRYANRGGYTIDRAMPVYTRSRSRELFKAIMVFINKKQYMPIGDQDE